ncbi:MAG: hypothetical protein H6832_06530 [Planctomycetes bacterium]|nr:hypothetical protein [Planctomycetota bacterium]
MNPSRDCPYMISGRLISCEMMPFAVLFVDGLTRCTHRLGRLVPAGVLVALLIALVWSEIVLMLPVFASPYKFWNLDV